MTERTTCLVAGGGPAGMVLGLLMARAGIEVTVLEKHGDFLRDFRGDTVHPTTLDLLDELGLGEEFAQLPQRHITQIRVPYGAGTVLMGDTTTLRGKHDYIAMVPQWDLLNLLVRAAKEEPSFTLQMNTEATGLMIEDGRVEGVEYRTKDGATGRIHADLTVAADGRTSVLRAAAGMSVRDFPTPMDVWWFELPRKDDDPSGLVGLITDHRASVLIDRGAYWQVAQLLHKGADAELRTKPVSTVVENLTTAGPWLADRTDAITSWDQVKLLNVKLDRLDRWYRKGFLCIGDAAHAMSPVGGVGINLAVQDAVATARLLAEPLRRGTLSTKDLARVQRRRMPHTVVIQGLQRFLHAKALRPTLAGEIEIARADRPPLPMRMVERFRWLRRIPAYVIGRGVRPEHAPDFARRPTA
jgi:2-polyprenyl-6-methoxyphenol hydroxylase-like FAD-dependent oxidoreductase